MRVAGRILHITPSTTTPTSSPFKPPASAQKRGEPKLRACLSVSTYVRRRLGGICDRATLCDRVLRLRSTWPPWCARRPWSSASWRVPAAKRLRCSPPVHRRRCSPNRAHCQFDPPNHRTHHPRRPPMPVRLKGNTTLPLSLVEAAPYVSAHAATADDRPITILIKLGYLLNHADRKGKGREYSQVPHRCTPLHNQPLPLEQSIIHGSILEGCTIMPENFSFSPTRQQRLNDGSR